MRIHGGGLVVLLLALAGCEPKETCVTVKRGGEACTLASGGTFQAGQVLTLAFRESCGSPCETGTLTCKVEHQGTVVNLSLEGSLCSQPEQACPDLCSLRVFECQLPALPAGDYQVRSPNGIDTTLKVAAQGVTRCAFTP